MKHEAEKDELQRQQELFHGDGVEDALEERQAAAAARRHQAVVRERTAWDRARPQPGKPYVIKGARPLTKRELRLWMDEIRCQSFAMEEVDALLQSA